MNIKCAVITGYHGYDVISFKHLFDSLPGVEVYIQHLENFVSSSASNRETYDCLLFYFMPRDLVAENGPAKEMALLSEALEKHTDPDRKAGSGIVVLHHAILAYPDWELWTEVTGLADRRNFDYFDDQILRCDIADPGHPVTSGIESWEMQDETYTLSEPVDGSLALVTTQYEPSMKTIAWTRKYREASVFCLESGHDAASWMNHNFRELLRRGILWSAGRLT